MWKVKICFHINIAWLEFSLLQLSCIWVAWVQAALRGGRAPRFHPQQPHTQSIPSRWSVQFQLLEVLPTSPITTWQYYFIPANEKHFEIGCRCLQDDNFFFWAQLSSTSGQPPLFPLVKPFCLVRTPSVMKLLFQVTSRSWRQKPVLCNFWIKTP